jgi:hypothetical protein
MTDQCYFHDKLVKFHDESVKFVLTHIIYSIESMHFIGILLPEGQSSVKSYFKMLCNALSSGQCCYRMQQNVIR